MRSTQSTVESYLAKLPADRRQTISTILELIRRNLPAGVSETMDSGMISQVIPAEKSPKTCNGQPMMLIGVSSKKQNCSLHLMSFYMKRKAAPK